MKLIELVRVPHNKHEFVLDGESFTIEHRPRSKMKIWKIHKRFGSASEYRVLSDVYRRVPVAFQRLAS